jgi:hypothetical protein
MTRLKVFISCLILTAGSSACNQSVDTGETQKKDSSSVIAEFAEIKDGETKEVYKHYIQLKDNLVTSDPAAAQKAGAELALALANIKGCENTSSLATKIASSNDLKFQRAQFIALSSDIIALLKHKEIGSGKLYVQHCPMVNEGEGAYWISSEKEIKNPYYGDEMLNCGSVTETIASK